MQQRDTDSEPAADATADADHAESVGDPSADHPARPIEPTAGDADNRTIIDPDIPDSHS